MEKTNRRKEISSCNVIIRQILMLRKTPLKRHKSWNGIVPYGQEQWIPHMHIWTMSVAHEGRERIPEGWAQSMANDQWGVRPRSGWMLGLQSQVLVLWRHRRSVSWGQREITGIVHQVCQWRVQGVIAAVLIHHVGQTQDQWSPVCNGMCHLMCLPWHVGHHCMEWDMQVLDGNVML